MADKSDHFTLLHFEINLFQHRLIGLIAEYNIPEGYRALDRMLLTKLRIQYLWLLVDDREYTVNGNNSVSHPSGHEHQPCDWPEDHRSICTELNQFTDIHLFADNHTAAKQQYEILSQLNEIVRNRR